ncbi:MAG: hypothetical protein ACHWZW_09155 [Spirulina sp.]
MTAVAQSINSVPIRLPDERWEHITQRHADLLGQQEILLETISNPLRILQGNENALMAIQEIKPGKWLVVVYKEENINDGFVITAFSTRKINALNRRQQLWP